jgi:tetratricopeptide (TPR) repeat protein
MRFAWIVLALLVVAAPAHADNTADARAHFDSGNAAYALGDYAAAAAEYEKAFALKPDPALLYNAAQAHRLAGNKQRALLLYQNYLRVYGKQVSNREEVQRHIATLKAAIESEQQAQTSPPTGTAPLGGPSHSTTAPPPATTTAPPAATTEAPATTAPAPSDNTLVASPQPAEKPLIKKPWFWAVVGGSALVVAGVAIGLGVGLSGDKDPKPSLGAVAGN